MSQEAARKLTDDELLHQAAIAQAEMRDAQADDIGSAYLSAWRWSLSLSIVAGERGIADWAEKVEAKTNEMRGGWFNVPRE